MTANFNTASAVNDTALLQSTQGFIAAGFACHVLRPRDKIPIEAGWQNGPVKTFEEFCASHRPGCNLGFRPGIPSSVNGFSLVVVDLDIRSDDPNHRAEARQALIELFGSERSPNVITGGGGEHYYIWCRSVDVPAKSATVLACSRETNGNKRAWQIELLSTGKNCVLPPSIHPSGTPYQWVSSDIPTGLPNGVRFALRRAQGNTITIDYAAVPRIPETPENVATLKSCLQAIPANLPYPEWRDIVFSIKAHGWSCGEEIARAWSESCPDKFSEEAFAKLWNSDKGPSHSGPLIGPQRVYRIAQDVGWRRKQSGKLIEGDLINGRAFARFFRGRFLYCYAERRWLFWDGTRWKRCDNGEEMATAKQVADMLLEEAIAASKNEPDGSRAQQLRKSAELLHKNAKRLDAMLSVAESEEGMAIANRSMLDADPWLLGVRNGVIDLRTGLLRDAVPEQLISRQATAAYVRDAQCPRFLALLNDAFGGDAETIAFVQRIGGYTLTGHVDEEVMIFMYGRGANGKSVIANIISGVMGDYAITLQADILSKKQSSANAARGDIARLAGARLALANETGVGDVWDEQLVKSLVSRERISARFNYGEMFDFMPSYKLWVRGNHQPGIRDDSDGMWRRLHLLAFLHQVPEGARIPDLDRQILAEESDGVLSWMVEGCLLWQREGLNPPETVRRATLAYRKDCDLIGEWLEERCTGGENLKVAINAAYTDFRMWCDGAGIRPMPRKTFTRNVKTRFGSQCHERGERAFCGFGLRFGMMPVPTAATT